MLNRKIVHVITGLDDGGAEGVLTRLCLHSENVSHIVISLMDAGKHGPSLQAKGIPVYCLDMKRGIPNPLVIFRLMRLISAQRPSAVQTWMYHADLLGGLAARFTGIRRVFWGVRRTSLEREHCTRVTLLIAKLCALLSKRIPLKIICCAKQAKETHLELGYEKNKLIIIPNGYSLSCFRSSLELRKSIRSQFDIDDDIFVIGMVGRFSPVKNHYGLLEALSIVAKRKVEFICVLVGKGVDCGNEDLVKQINDLGLNDKVILAGQRDDMPAVMNLLDTHVLSSRSEGFPNVVAEAMACGTPCISTNVGDAADIIGDTGLCCAPEDPEALAHLIITMWREWSDERDVWQKRREKSSKRISDKYSLESMVAAYEACWFDAQVAELKSSVD